MEEQGNRLNESGSGRRRLMTAAGKLFATSGLSEVTVAQILDHSGVKAPTLYHHFGGKEGLYVAWVCSTLDVAEAEFRALAASQPTLRGFLIEAARILQSPRSMDVLQALRDRKWLSDPDSVEVVNDSIRAAIVRPVARAIENGAPVSSPEDASQIFVHMVSVRRPCYHRPDAKEAVAAEEIVDAFLSGILAGTRAPDAKRGQSIAAEARVPEARVEVK